jgi:hypothetical protein
MRDGVDVCDNEAPRANDGGSPREQVQARRILPPGIAVGKVPADVAGAGRAQNGIDDRVAERVGVGMAVETTRERDDHAAEHQRPPGHEAVQVVTHPDSNGPGRLRGIGHGYKPSCQFQIFRRRDLDVARVALHETDRVARLLRER